MKQPWIPALRSMNFALYEDGVNRFSDPKDLYTFIARGGLNGLEVIRAGEPVCDAWVPGDMINGVHLYFQVFWIDFWKGNYEWLDWEFDDRKQWIEYYGGMEREAYLNCIRSDLQYAKAVGAKYVVFHINEVSLEEAFHFQPRYSHEEVIDAALEVINLLLAEEDYPFEFLVENQPWQGFNLLNPEITRRLYDGIRFPKKGIMFDVGHYMNNNPYLREPMDALHYVEEMLDTHEASGIPITEWIRGVHLQMSLGGEETLKGIREWPDMEEDFRKLPFYERFSIAYRHIGTADQHQPFLCEGVEELISRLKPEYLTEEFVQPSREIYGEYIKKQGALLGFITEESL